MLSIDKGFYFGASGLGTRFRGLMERLRRGVAVCSGLMPQFDVA